MRFCTVVSRYITTIKFLICMLPRLSSRAGRASTSQEQTKPFKPPSGCSDTQAGLS